MSTIRQDLHALEEIFHKSLRCDRNRFRLLVRAEGRLRNKIVRRFEALENENNGLRILYARAKKKEILPCACEETPCPRCEGRGWWVMDLEAKCD